MTKYKRSRLDVKPPKNPYEHIRCSKELSFPDTLLPDEELMHVNLGLVTYTEACMVMDKLQGDRYRIHVEVDGDLKKVGYHQLIRRNNTGNWSVRLCHMNPDHDFIKLHFYMGE
jgi:hypothetical protein